MGDGLRVLRGLRLRRSRSRLACPRCGSFKISLSSALSGWLTPEDYYCQECGYRGPILLEVGEQEQKETGEPSREE